MTQPTFKHDNGKGNDPGFTPPGQQKAKKQRADLQYLLMAKGGGGGGGGGGKSGGGGSGGSGGNGKSNNGNGLDKSNNGKSGDKVQNKDLKKEDREAKKEKAKSKNGYRQKGKYTNKGKHKGWYKNGKLPAEKVEVTYYLNDVSDPLTQVLMTYGEDGKYDAAYTYGLERIEVEDIDETRPESQDPLYYLYNGLGSVTYMVKPDGNVRDHYRYDEYGKPAPGNSKLSEDGRINLNNTFGYTGEQWDEESNLLYLRARYYEPETGRFLSRDTYGGNLENPLSKHLYAYVGNNPIKRTDPTGNRWLTIYNWGKDVRELQLRLYYLGILSEKDLTGYYGKITTKAVNQYKELRGIYNKYSTKGVVGDLTWKRLASESKITNFNGRVVLLNAPKAVFYEGHEAIVIIKSNGSGEYYSFAPVEDWESKEDNVEHRTMPKSEINKGTESVRRFINNNYRQGGKPYERNIEIKYFSNSQIQNMINYAEVKRSYNLFTYNCVDYVQGALKAAGLYVQEGVIPNTWHDIMELHY